MAMGEEATATTHSILEVAGSNSGEDETCGTFVMHNEDHTLGNSLRYIIMKNPEVQFCGYSIPHPSENKINFRIQSKGTPTTDILRRGLSELTALCEHVLATFETSVREYKRDHQEESMEVDGVS